MNNTLKVGLGVGGALLLGLVVGYVLGSSGKHELESTAQQEQTRAKEAEASLKELEEDCARRVMRARTAKQLLLTKERLLRAMVELYANNYGLTSQHLGIARKHLKSAIKGLKGKKHVATAQDLYERMGGAQTLAMRLDPMARVHIEQILAQLQKLPGAH
jgi:tmRNA-binding protein